MAKLFAIALEEMSYHLRQWTFYLTVVVMMLVFAGVGALPRLQATAQESPLGPVETIFTVSDQLQTPTGYVDHARLIAHIPPEQAANFRAFSDEAAAAAALRQGEIESYYIIAADYLRSGEVIHISANPQLLAGSDDVVKKLLQDNLLHAIDNPDLASRLETPLNLTYNGPPPPVLHFIPPDLNLDQLLSAGLVVGLFALIMNIGGTLLLRALQREVRARVLELLIASTTPEQFIGGKLLGLTGLALGQAGLSLGVGWLVYGQAMGRVGPGALPLPALALSLCYLMLGYLAFCGGMMAVAALWPNLPESALLLMIVRFLVFAPLIGVLFILVDANSPLAVGLTLLPLTAPLLMPFRLLLGAVPAWQWGLGSAGLAAWAAFSIWLSMRLFRAHSLLTGRPVTLSAFWQALCQRA